jgi:hypothetical protein
MAMSVVATQLLGKRLCNLDIDHSASDRQIYLDCRVQYIKAGEGVRYYVYDDKNGKFAAEALGQHTVGVGFNMDRPTARQEWDATFQKTVDFEAVWCGKRALSSVEVNALLTACLTRREQELRQCYGGAGSVFWRTNALRLKIYGFARLNLRISNPACGNT